MKYLWRIPNDYPENLIGEYQRKDSPDRFDLQKGCVLPTEWGTPVLIYRAPSVELQKYDDLANNAMVPLVSPRLAKALKKAYGDIIQLIPTRIEADDGFLESYSFVNVTNLGETIDLTESEFTCIPGTNTPMNFSKIRFSKEPDQRAIVREKNYTSFIVISEDVKALFEKIEAQGVGVFEDQYC